NNTLGGCIIRRAAWFCHFFEAVMFQVWNNLLAWGHDTYFRYHIFKCFKEAGIRFVFVWKSALQPCYCYIFGSAIPRKEIFKQFRFNTQEFSLGCFHSYCWFFNRYLHFMSLKYRYISSARRLIKPFITFPLAVIQFHSLNASPQLWFFKAL